MLFAGVLVLINLAAVVMVIWASYKVETETHLTVVDPAQAKGDLWDPHDPEVRRIVIRRYH